jgi:hypothetical protein
VLVGGACNGDSGGPALIEKNGAPLVVGTVSYGDSGCQSFDVLIRTSAHYASFIAPVLAANGTSATTSSAGGDGGSGGAGGAGGRAALPKPSKGTSTSGCSIESASDEGWGSCLVPLLGFLLFARGALGKSTNPAKVVSHLSRKPRACELTPNRRGFAKSVAYVKN